MVERAEHDLEAVLAGHDATDRHERGLQLGWDADHACGGGFALAISARRRPSSSQARFFSGSPTQVPRSVPGAELGPSTQEPVVKLGQAPGALQPPRRCRGTNLQTPSVPDLVGEPIVRWLERHLSFVVCAPSHTQVSDIDQQTNFCFKS